MVVCLLIAGSARADPIAVTIGDSIVRTYPEPHPLDVPIQGWGAKMNLFATGITWVNRAVGSQSTRTFVESGHWAAALAENPDYILIQFGYGDATPWEGYATPTEFRANLHQMILEARAAGAEPILVTPAGLRHVAPDGVHVTRPNGLEEYAEAMIQQAAEDGVHLIDMQTWSLDIYDEIGFPDAQEIFGFYHPDGFEDRLHFGIEGAAYAASFVADHLPVMTEASAPGVSIFPYDGEASW